MTDASGGLIRLARVDGTIDVETAGGSIQIDSASGGIQAETAAGAIHLTNVAGTVRAASATGCDLCDFPSIQVSNREGVFAGGITAREELNGGGPILRIHNTNGSIQISCFKVPQNSCLY